MTGGQFVEECGVVAGGGGQRRVREVLGGGEQLVGVLGNVDAHGADQDLDAGGERVQQPGEAGDQRGLLGLGPQP